MIKCRYCNREAKSVNSNTQHEIRCKENTNRIIVEFPERRGKKREGFTGQNQYTKAKKLGLPLPTVSNETRQKISKASKRQEWSEERRVNHSKKMKTVVEQNPKSYTSSNRGRVKQIEYNGIKFIGHWELVFYKWARDQNYSVVRPLNGFQYSWKGERTYFPDFYILELDLYIEVKGYETERDRAKWSQFPKKLRIIKEDEIKRIKKDCFEGL